MCNRFSGCVFLTCVRMKSKVNNRVVATAGYGVSGVYAIASVSNAVNGFPLASLFCGCASALAAAATNECTHENQIVPADV